MAETLEGISRPGGLDAVRFGVRTSAWCLFAGVGLGALWLLLAPRVALVVTSTGEPAPHAKAIDFVSNQPVGFIGADLVLGLMLALAGLVLGVLVLRRRPHDLGTVAAALVGGLVLGLVAWQFGQALASAVSGFTLEQVQTMADGTRLEAPLRLRSMGVLFVAPMLSCFVVLLRGR